MPLQRTMVSQLDDDAICISSNRGSMLSGGVNRVPTANETRVRMFRTAFY